MPANAPDGLRVVPVTEQTIRDHAKAVKRSGEDIPMPTLCPLCAEARKLGLL